MYNVYVPYDDINLYSYYYFNNDLSIIYATNDNVNFDIIDSNNHYNIINSNLDISTLSLIPIDNNLIVNNWKYRKDLTDICITFVIFATFLFLIPIFLFSRIFKKRWL